MSQQHEEAASKGQMLMRVILKFCILDMGRNCSTAVIDAYVSAVKDTESGSPLSV